VAKYKPYSYTQGQLIPAMFAKQVQPGTFEFTKNLLIASELDLTCIDHRFKDDENRRPGI